MSAPVVHSQNLGRRLARRTLPSLLRYKFLHEYGYDKGAVVVAAIVEDICTVVRNYYRRPDDLEPGQLIYLCPAADERQRKGKTMAHTRLVPVRLTVVAQADIDAMVAGDGRPRAARAAGAPPHPRGLRPRRGAVRGSTCRWSPATPTAACQPR